MISYIIRFKLGEFEALGNVYSNNYVLKAWHGNGWLTDMRQVRLCPWHNHLITLSHESYSAKHDNASAPLTGHLHKWLHGCGLENTELQILSNGSVVRYYQFQFQPH